MTKKQLKLGAFFMLPVDIMLPLGVMKVQKKKIYYLVIPELQKRGIFRTEYEGLTLRENLGLEKPVNQFTRVIEEVK